jgi:hypothetical protein
VGVAAMVLGIIGLVLAIIPAFGITALVGAVLGIVALILGIVGRKQAVERQEKTGAATAGLVLGIIALVLGGSIFAACQYCQHKMGKAIEKGMKQGVKGLGTLGDMFATQLCTELNAAGDRCKMPSMSFGEDAAQIHAVYRTQRKVEPPSVTFHRVSKSGSLRSTTLVGSVKPSVYKAKPEGTTVVLGTWKRPASGWVPGRYKVKIRVGKSTLSRGFFISGGGN